MRVRLIAGDLEILEAERIDLLHVALDDETRQRQGHAFQLLVGLIEMIEIEMRITERMHELASFEAADMSDHVGEQRIGCDVERNTDEYVAGTLIELAGQFAVGDIELEQAMAGRERHPVDIGGVPRGDDEAARIRSVSDA